MKTSVLRKILVLLSPLLLAACGGDYDSIGAPIAPMTPVNTIALPNGFQPEGVAADGDTLYIGSIPSGAIYRADAISGAGTVLVPAQAGRSAIGLKFDSGKRLIVAGGATGMAFIYDGLNGQNLAAYTLTTASPTFVNDVAIAFDAAWFTDSLNPVLYRVALPADGTLGGPEAVTTLPLSGDLQFTPGVINLNGIAVAGNRLIVVQSNTGFLFAVDPATGVTQRIDLGAETVENGDGILVEGQTLYVVQNRQNLVTAITLAADLATGTVRARVSHAAFDVPTTIAGNSRGLYVVNARFGIVVTPDTPYNVVRFDRP
jgi:sugar lactone lactonase YvrE